MDRDVETVRRLLDVFRATDEATISASLDARFGDAVSDPSELGELVRWALSPDVVIDMSALRGQILEGRAHFEGMSGWMEFWGTWLEPWEGFDYDYGEFEPHGDHVVVEMLIKAKGRGSGAPVEWRQHQVYTFESGKIIGLRAFDTHEEAVAFAAGD